VWSAVERSNSFLTSLEGGKKIDSDYGPTIQNKQKKRGRHVGGGGGGGAERETIRARRRPVTSIKGMTA